MLSLMNRALEPSVPYPDKIMYMTSLQQYQSFCSDNSAAEKIKDLLTSSNTRFQGLQILEIALQQNPDMYLKGRWTVILNGILRDSGSPILKEHACKVLCLIIPYLAEDPSVGVDLEKFMKDLVQVLLKKIYENVEWTEAACKCIYTCLKSSPQLLACYKDQLLNMILKQVSDSVSSKTFEVFADCFCEMPNCVKTFNSSVYKDLWNKQYLTTLNTMKHLLSTFFSLFNEDPYADVRMTDAGVYIFEDDAQDIFSSFMKDVRRFINLSRCLAKMLSTKSKHSVTIPVKLTFDCLNPLFESLEKIAKPIVTLQIIYSTLAQMQIAALTLLESIILNFNLIPFSYLNSHLMCNALQQYKTINVTAVSRLRYAVWKLLRVWLSVHGAKVSSDITNNQQGIIEELLKDISIEDKESSQTSSIQTHHKSKKNVCMSTGSKGYCINKSQQSVCKEALKSLEVLIYAGAHNMSTKMIQNINTKVVQVSYALHMSGDPFPFPYDDDSCRKNLYSVLLAIVVISNPYQTEAVQCSVGIFKNALRDPSVKVTRLCHKAAATCRLFLHPKRPPPLHLVGENTEAKQNVPQSLDQIPEWISEDYVSNIVIENVSETPENGTPREGQTFHNPNESEVHDDEFMEVEKHFPGQVAENQCNGEDILDMQNSSQCQDDVESEDEEEEDDDERSYGDEEMNQEEIQPETMYIPSTSKLQVLNPVHISPETVQSAEPEYEELRPCAKTDDNIVDSSNKNMHLNGVRSIVPDEDVPSSSQPTVANENGIYGLEDEDLEEEEDDEEDEEEENASFPAEKKVPEFYDPSVKRQKLDTDEAKEEPQNDEREHNSRSPTLSEMKADFCCNEVEDVKS